MLDAFNAVCGQFGQVRVATYTCTSMWRIFPAPWMPLAYSHRVVRVRILSESISPPKANRLCIKYRPDLQPMRYSNRVLCIKICIKGHNGGLYANDRA
jgi:hypothetical protein